ncbi:Cysteine dioxygenase type 1 [Tupaia chinensis]|uniref:Cysteine dioxygenase n=1 Tax=Tupaia chinensis TaxID=246437 RepID=L9LCM3_TUPCH|nr:Cysteine dioxygenase type 1 [Tupaia chinensis]
MEQTQMLKPTTLAELVHFLHQLAGNEVYVEQMLQGNLTETLFAWPDKNANEMTKKSESILRKTIVPTSTILLAYIERRTSATQSPL